jgi:hypothetical protein
MVAHVMQVVDWWSVAIAAGVAVGVVAWWLLGGKKLPATLRTLRTNAALPLLAAPLLLIMLIVVLQTLEARMTGKVGIIILGVPFVATMGIIALVRYLRELHRSRKTSHLR